MVCSFAPVLKMNDSTEKQTTVWSYPELKCKGQGSLGRGCALLLSLSSRSFPWCHLYETWADTAWHIIPLSPGAEAHQPGLHHFHQCCFSSGQCKGFSCQFYLTCHRRSFPISISMCNHVLSSLENAEQ